MNRRSKSLFILGAVMALTLTGCAAMMDQWRAQNCNYDGAYRAGMNDARKGEEMRAGFAQPCSSFSQAAAQRGYREGYTAGAGAAPIAAPAGSGGGSGWRCIEAYGKKACGYHCVQAYGKLACAQYPEHNCVEAYGKIRCGLRCRDEYGSIKCDG